ncbi:MAG: sigma-70 family RNA polymerase sigma factor [Verrucomicrobia bacterium]|nr:sigma-70 family RNA polymerase sigma factor [Verrucomicrobiota bacterium]
MTRAQAGDPVAQGELVQLYTARVTGFVRPILSDPTELEDVVQTVFIKVILQLGSLRDPGLFEAWLFRLARNTAFDAYRRSRCRPAPLRGEADLARMADPDSSRLVAEIMEALEVAAARLSRIDRSLITMIIQGHSYRTIAQREGLTIGAVKLRLARMRPFLRACVGGAIGCETKSRTRFRVPVRYRSVGKRMR